MDTKLISNDNEYTIPMEEMPVTETPGSKRRHVNGMFILMAVIFGCCCVYVCATNLVWYYDNIRRVSENSTDDIISRSWSIQDSLWRYAKNLHRYYVYFNGEGYDNLSQSQRLSNADLENYRSELMLEYEVELRGMLSRLDEYPLDYAQLREYPVDYGYEQMMSEFGDLHERYNYDLSADELYEKALEAKDRNYVDVKSYLNSQSGFQYYIVNSSNNRFYTNIPELSVSIDEYVKYTQATGQYHAVLTLNDNVFWRDEFTGVPLAQAFQRDNFSGYIFIVRSDPPAELDYEWVDASRVNSLNDYRLHYWALLAVSLLFLAISAALALSRPRSVIAANNLIFRLYSSLPLVVKAIGIVFVALLVFYECLVWPFDLVKRLLEYHDIFESVLFIAAMTCAGVFLLMTAEYALKIIREPRKLKSEPEIRWLRIYLADLRYVMLAADITVGLLYGVLVASVILALGFMIYLLSYWPTGIGIIFGLAVGVIMLVGHRFICGYARLVYCVKQMASGHMGSIPETRGLFTQTLRRLNEIDKGLERAVKDMMKSERLKTELISNVSHDLKTPLTSIINYVALLKELPLQNPAAEYVDVLDKKSERLRGLIEDLFEAAKLQSGSVELDKEQLDLVNLLNQAMGELDEKIRASGIDFRFSHAPEHINCDCDGNKLWRAFDNILVNIIKYSPSGSRAYIEAVQDSSGIRLVFKNVSAYELNIEADELFNRFKRGDSARATEGSGLGLSIARGIVELHGGRMDIEVDGDLFKVVVRL